MAEVQILYCLPHLEVFFFMHSTHSIWFYVFIVFSTAAKDSDVRNLWFAIPWKLFKEGDTLWTRLVSSYLILVEAVAHELENPGNLVDFKVELLIMLLLLTLFHCLLFIHTYRLDSAWWKNNQALPEFGDFYYIPSHYD